MFSFSEIIQFGKFFHMHFFFNLCKTCSISYSFVLFQIFLVQCLFNKPYVSKMWMEFICLGNKFKVAIFFEYFALVVFLILLIWRPWYKYGLLHQILLSGRSYWMVLLMLFFVDFIWIRTEFVKSMFF